VKQKAKNKAKLWGLCLSLIFLLLNFFPVNALAASEPELDQMNISVMSEYDDPRVLAVWEGTLSEKTQLPMQVKFYIPKSATKIQVGMACEIPEGQGHRCKIYDTKEVANDSFNELTYQVDSARNLFLEYYWDPFNGKTTGDKEFVYEFKAPYNIKALNIQIREPANGVKGFKVEPASSSVTSDQEGAKVHTYSFNNVTAGQVFTFKANYTKETAGVDKPKQVSDVQAGVPSAAASSNPTAVRIFIFLIIVLLTIGALGFYWRTQVAQEAVATAGGSSQSKAVRVAKPKTKGATTGGKPKKVRYCSNCGSELTAKAKFCSECGEPV